MGLLDKTERVLMNDREVSSDEFVIDGATIDDSAGQALPQRGRGACKRLGLDAWLDGVAACRCALERVARCGRQAGKPWPKAMPWT